MNKFKVPGRTKQSINVVTIVLIDKLTNTHSRGLSVYEGFKCMHTVRSGK